MNNLRSFRTIIFIYVIQRQMLVIPLHTLDICIRKSWSIKYIYLERIHILSLLLPLSKDLAVDLFMLWS